MSADTEAFEANLATVIETFEGSPAELVTILVDRFARLVVINTDERGDEAFVALVRNHLKRIRMFTALGRQAGDSINSILRDALKEEDPT